MSNIGKTIWSRGREVKGVVTSVVERRCATGDKAARYLVKWDDLPRALPCTMEVRSLPNGDLEIA